MNVTRLLLSDNVLMLSVSVLESLCLTNDTTSEQCTKKQDLICFIYFYFIIFISIIVQHYAICFLFEQVCCDQLFSMC